MVRKTMTAGRIALLWIVLAAAWPILNLNYPFEEVSRYVSAPARNDLVTRYLNPFPAREFAWFGFAFFTVGMTWRHYRPNPNKEE